MALDDTKKTKDFKVVGTRPNRPDGIDKVTGRARFGADMVAPGMLTGRVLRSPHAHARILRIDTSKAEALPGVKAVVTRADFGDVPDHVADVIDNCMMGTRWPRLPPIPRRWRERRSSLSRWSMRFCRM